MVRSATTVGRMRDRSVTIVRPHAIAKERIALPEIFFEREELEIGFRLPQHPRIGRARHQPVEVGDERLLARIEGHQDVGVEQRRRGGAIGQRERIAHYPRL